MIPFEELAWNATGHSTFETPGQGPPQTLFRGRTG
jgi:hypothetical protein